MNSTEAGSRPGPRRPAARRSRDARNGLLRAAETFVRQFRDENPAAGSPAGRLRQVRRQIGSEGTYEQTTAELEWACRVAWRNSSRCIGRAYWRALQVRDRRHVWAGDDVAGEAVTHLKEATNGGRIRPLITVLAPDAPGRPGPRILSPQLVRYAGYQAGDGTVTGDPLNTGITRLALRLGWPGGSPRGRFDILPLVVRQPDPNFYRHPAITEEQHGGA